MPFFLLNSNQSVFVSNQLSFFLFVFQCHFPFPELLETQTGLLQNPPHELREKCFTPLHGAIMSNSGHMLRLGLLGLQVRQVAGITISSPVIHV